MKIMHLEDNQAMVEIGGAKRTIRMDIVDRPASVGDYVIVHAGYAIRVIDETEANETLKYFEEILTRDAQASERIPK